MRTHTRDEFRLEWFSGTGRGGQHRNKHQNCCRITHLPTGLRAQSTRHKERVANQRDAFRRLAGMLLAQPPEERRTSNEVVRTYHFERGVVTDHSSGLTSTPKTVLAGDLDGFREGHGKHPLPRTGR